MSRRHKPIVSPILVGRVHEVEVLEQAVADAERGAGRCILVAGEAGVGKSRLVTEILTRVANRNFLTLQGYCSEQDVVFPYAPWIDLLRSFFARLTPAEVRN